jgi:Tfp pilus assembly protein PilO
MIPVYGFWIVPQNKDLKAQQLDIAALEAETLDYQDKIKKLNNLDEELKNPIYDNILQRIPTNLEQERFILLLQQIASRSGFVFQNISFTKGQNPAIETSTLSANFSIKGRAEKLPSFLEAIEKSPRFMGLESFSYSVETINGIDIIDMSVPIYTFAQSNEN